MIGAYGAMGRLAGAAVRDADGLELAAEVGRGDPLDLLLGAEVAVDLTNPDVVMDHVRWCVEHGLDVVVGTSGMSPDRLAEVEQWLAGQSEVGVLVVPNFSVGAVLMMRFAEEAAAVFESVEVVELHHPGKRDAPSGTATATARRLAAARASARRDPAPDATADDPLGSRGGLVEGIPVHSVRLPGLVAHQEVLLGSAGETLTIRHDMLDRAAAMPGLVAAVRYVVDHPGLTVGLEPVLGLA